jgi:hypothetical protein
MGGVATRGGNVTVRVLLAVAVLMALYGCGQSSPAPQESEKEGGVEPKTVKPTGGAEEETTQQVVGNMPISGGMGEAVEGDSYDLRSSTGSSPTATTT